ncbi:MAG: hypothetical protein M3Q58_02115 [Bacteroidota bacterium]|nr:hypothetical protein [Bacteroidota bacterium]
MSSFKLFVAYDIVSSKELGKKWINVSQIVEFSDNGNKTTRVKLSNGEHFDINVLHVNVEGYIMGLKTYKW